MDPNVKIMSLVCDAAFHDRCDGRLRSNAITCDCPCHVKFVPDIARGDIEVTLRDAYGYLVFNKEDIRALARTDRGVETLTGMVAASFTKRLPFLGATGRGYEEDVNAVKIAIDTFVTSLINYARWLDEADKHRGSYWSQTEFRAYLAGTPLPDPKTA